MSRFIDELNRVAKAAPQPMGFKAAPLVPEEPRIQLVAGLAQTADVNRLADGADAVLLRLSKATLTAKALQNIAAALPETPWGVWTEDTGDKKLEALDAAGGDFAVFPTTCQFSAATPDDKAGRILQVESSLSEGLLRAVNDLPVDAVLADITYEADSIAWHHLMHFQRLANLLAKPLLTTVPPSVTADELKTLWEAGVDGVVVTVGAGQPAGRLRELRQSIGELKFPPSRKRGKSEALLPHLGGKASTVTEDEEIEEEEDYE